MQHNDAPQLYIHIVYVSFLVQFCYSSRRRLRFDNFPKTWPCLCVNEGALLAPYNLAGLPPAHLWNDQDGCVFGSRRGLEDYVYIIYISYFTCPMHFWPELGVHPKNATFAQGCMPTKLNPPPISHPFHKLRTQNY